MKGIVFVLALKTALTALGNGFLFYLKFNILMNISSVNCTNLICFNILSCNRNINIPFPVAKYQHPYKPQIAINIILFCLFMLRLIPFFF